MECVPAVVVACISQSNNNHLMALCGWNVAALISVCDQPVLMELTTHRMTSSTCMYAHVKSRETGAGLVGSTFYYYRLHTLFVMFFFYLEY